MAPPPITSLTLPTPSADFDMLLSKNNPIDYEHGFASPYSPTFNPLHLSSILRSHESPKSPPDRSQSPGYKKPMTDKRGATLKHPDYLKMILTADSTYLSI
jgi:hypothetical protein